MSLYFKRKRKEPLTTEEKLAQEYHEQIKGYLHKAMNSLVQLGREIEYFHPLTGTIPEDNNLVSRQAARLQGAGNLFVTMSTDKAENHCVRVPEYELNAGQLPVFIY